MGGSRRRSAKRSSRNSRVAKGKKVMRGGNFAEFKGPLDGTGAGAEWGSMENLAATPAGNLLPNNGSDLVAAPIVGGRRRRRASRTRKGKKSRRVTRRRRTMRGGASYAGSANSGVSFNGDGVAGTADPIPYASNIPGANFNHQQVAGVWQV